MRTHYDTMGIPTGATQDEEKKAFHALAHKHHPDKTGGNADLFKQITQAHHVLSDPERRRSYDLQMGIRRSGPATQPAKNPNEMYEQRERTANPFRDQSYTYRASFNFKKFEDEASSLSEEQFKELLKRKFKGRNFDKFN